MNTSVEHRTDSVEHLDFTPACMCASRYCGHGKECGAEGAAILVLHMFHRCTSPKTDADGNCLGVICQPCLDRCTARVAALLRKTPAGTECRSCGAPLAAVSDVIRDVRPL